jgi:hypothetical protein
MQGSLQRQGGNAGLVVSHRQSRSSSAVKYLRPWHSRASIDNAPARLALSTNTRQPGAAQAKNRTAHVVHAYSSSKSGSSLSRYAQAGPYRTATIPAFKLPLGQSPSGPVSMQVEVVHPVGVGRCPLAIVSPGFLLDSSLFRWVWVHMKAPWLAASLLVQLEMEGG